MAAAGVVSIDAGILDLLFIAIPLLALVGYLVGWRITRMIMGPLANVIRGARKKKVNMILQLLERKWNFIPLVKREGNLWRTETLEVNVDPKLVRSFMGATAISLNHAIVAKPNDEFRFFVEKLVPVAKDKKGRPIGGPVSLRYVMEAFKKYETSLTTVISRIDKIKAGTLTLDAAVGELAPKLEDVDSKAVFRTSLEKTLSNDAKSYRDELIRIQMAEQVAIDKTFKPKVESDGSVVDVISDETIHMDNFKRLVPLSSVTDIQTISARKEVQMMKDNKFGMGDFMKYMAFTLVAAGIIIAIRIAVG